jgi:hypothetical protein
LPPLIRSGALETTESVRETGASSTVDTGGAFSEQAAKVVKAAMHATRGKRRDLMIILQSIIVLVFHTLP